jgi:hypothetical protein
VLDLIFIPEILILVHDNVVKDSKNVKIVMEDNGVPQMAHVLGKG